MSLFEKAVYTVAAIDNGSPDSRSFWRLLVVRYRTKPTERSRCQCSVPVGSVCGFSGTRRGSWLLCWENAGHNSCRLSDVDGNTEYEGDFVTYGDKGPLGADQLKIDPEKSRDLEVWVGDALVPLVFLENGKILIPANKYEEGRRLLEHLEPNR